MSDKRKRKRAFERRLTKQGQAKSPTSFWVIVIVVLMALALLLARATRLL